MKTLKLTALVVIFLSMNFVYTQEKVKKVKKFKTWVSLNDGFEIYGILYQLKDSSITVTNTKMEKSKDIYIKNIQEIKIRRKNSIGRGAVIGGASGLVAGSLIGLAKGGEGFETIGYGINLTVIGTGIGILTGTIKKKFDINGNLDNYTKNKEELRKYAIKKD
jgi:hypothetical protein